MKKQMATAVCAIALAGCLGMFGCSSGSGDAAKEEQKPESTPAAQPEAAPQQAAKYGVTIDEGTVGADYSDASAIVVTFTFTNNSDKATSFMAAISAKAFQNGVELDSAIMTEGIDAQSTINEIKPGATTTVQRAYLLDDQSDVTVECSELISFDDTLLAEKTFSVA